MHDTLKLQVHNTRMIAHRGLSGLEPENTNAAFVAAGNRNYYGIETDIHRTIDGHFVIYHDDSTLRLTGVDWRIEDHTLEELRSLVIKDKNGCTRGDLVIPTLDEYIRICKNYGKHSVVELKNHFEVDDIRRIIEVIQREEWLKQTTFISFDLDNLIAIREMLPQQTIQYLVRAVDPNITEILLKYSFDIDACYADLTPEQVQFLHKAGCKVNVWTVNSVEDGNRMVEMGVDFITTDILECLA